MQFYNGRLLGIFRIQCSRLRGIRAEVTAMHGRSGMFSTIIPQNRFNRLICNPQQRPASGPKNNINYHLSRMYPKIKGPHKRD